jgi:uncharacterized protein with FMN-binding domain
MKRCDAKRRSPLRRILLSSAATVSATVALLALKPHVQATAPAAAQAASRPRTSQVAPSSSTAQGETNAAATTYDGSLVQTRFGDIQVRITVSGGTISAVDALHTPDRERRSEQISSWSVPTLISETLDVQSANVDTVSGATYTSDGYRESLQSALDAAGIR